MNSYSNEKLLVLSVLVHERQLMDQKMNQVMTAL